MPSSIGLAVFAAFLTTVRLSSSLSKRRTDLAQVRTEQPTRQAAQGKIPTRPSAVHLWQSSPAPIAFAYRYSSARPLQLDIPGFFFPPTRPFGKPFDKLRTGSGRALTVLGKSLSPRPLRLRSGQAPRVATPSTDPSASSGQAQGGLSPRGARDLRLDSPAAQVKPGVTWY